MAIDKTLTKEYMCADAKATGDAIKEIGKVDYYEDIVVRGTVYGKGYYLETCNMVILHMAVRTTTNIANGEIFAELNSLKKNIQIIENVCILDTEGNGYGFKFDNKYIVAQSDIPQGAVLSFDICLKTS
ncbi:MAG: hypothetical protein IKU66_05240 [Clostridia bacterium]|nr:hypothetical protein [Clostridia bacterium]